MRTDPGEDRARVELRPSGGRHGSELRGVGLCRLCVGVMSGPYPGLRANVRVGPWVCEAQLCPRS